MSWTTPRKAILLTASAEGGTPLGAFDNALLRMGIGNVNLVRLSSVIPAHVSWLEKLPEDIPVGMLLPTVYAEATASQPGRAAVAALGVGLRPDGAGGLIYEYSDGDDPARSEEMVRKMVEEGFSQRGWRLDRFFAGVAQARVVERPVAAVAAVVMFPY
ncbi:pyruvoyl-dependent arginine decarboxylase [Oceanithermus sp.]